MKYAPEHAQAIVTMIVKLRTDWLRSVDVKLAQKASTEDWRRIDDSVVSHPEFLNSSSKECLLPSGGGTGSHVSVRRPFGLVPADNGNNGKT